MISEELFQKLKIVQTAYEEMDALTVYINNDLANVSLCRELRQKEDNEIYEDYLRLVKSELTELNNLMARNGEILIKNNDVLSLIPKDLRYGVAIQFLIEDLDDTKTIEEAIKNYRKAIENPPDDMKKVIYESQKIAQDREGFIYSISEKNEEYKTILGEIIPNKYETKEVQKEIKETSNKNQVEKNSRKEPITLKTLINLMKTKSE